jgi:hypothetical protein
MSAVAWPKFLQGRCDAWLCWLKYFLPAGSAETAEFVCLLHSGVCNENMFIYINFLSRFVALD